MATTTEIQHPMDTSNHELLTQINFRAAYGRNPAICQASKLLLQAIPPDQS